MATNLEIYKCEECSLIVEVVHSGEGELAPEAVFDIAADTVTAREY